MRKRLFIVVCLMACIQCGWAQNTVESIRKRYADIKEMITEKTGEEENFNDGATFMQCYKVEASHWLPGTGGHRENITFYFDEKEGKDEVYSSHYLTFATTKYNYSALEYYEEYLYDEDGKIAFIYAFSPYETIEDEGSPNNELSLQIENRFYFNKGKLMHAVIKTRPVEGNATTPFKVDFEGNKLNEKYREELQRYMDNAEKYRKLFDTLDETTYGY